MKAKKMDVRCECGEWSGDMCEWTGPMTEMVLVEYMPEQFRSSHEAAGNMGCYPHNGARRIWVERSCADRMLRNDPDWVQVIA